MGSVHAVRLVTHRVWEEGGEAEVAAGSEFGAVAVLGELDI